MIFGFAYTRRTEFLLISKLEWERDDRSKRRQSGHYIPNPFPGPKVDAFMVSKSYFANAAKAYMGALSLMRGGCNSRSLLTTITNPGICAAYVKELEVDMISVLYRIHNLCTRLQKLTFVLCDDFRDFIHAEAWERVLDERDFTQFAGMSSLLAFRGLQHFSIRAEKLDRLQQFSTRADESKDVKMGEREQIWESNIRRLETYIKSRVLLPKQRTTKPGLSLQESTSMPLYAGSAVSAGSSQLIGNCLSVPTSKMTTPAFRSVLDFGMGGGQANGTGLKNDDIPNSLEDFHLLLMTKGAEVMRWVLGAKGLKKEV